MSSHSPEKWWQWILFIPYAIVVMIIGLFKR